MPNTTNKVNYGLQDVHYALVTETNGALTFGTPVAMPGAVSLSMEKQGERNAFRADNRDYFVTYGNNGYEGDLEIAKVPESFLTDVLGFTKDGDMYIENTNAQSRNFALLFQFEGDQSATRHVFWYCSASLNNIESETTDENIEVKTVTLNLSASARPDTHDVRAFAESSDSRYATWYTAVPEPASQSTGG